MMPTSDDEPTNVRYRVLGMLCVLSFILYLDRICISQAVSSIERDLGLSHKAMGYVLGAFTLAYGLFEVPIGHWGDRYGSRGVLARIAIWWSVFTMLTGACTGLVTLVTVRFLFGAGEAGALPNTVRVIARWFPPGERGAAQGLILTAALVGGAISPIVAQSLIQHPQLGWRGAFFVLGLPGILWAAAFYFWFRDDPAEHKSVNDSERKMLEICRHQSTEHHAVPWQFVLTQRNIWMFGIIASCCSFTTYFFFSWYPTYMEKGRGVDPAWASRFASLVLASGAVGSLLGGYLSDQLVRRTGNSDVRRLVGIVCLTSAGMTMGYSQFCEQPWLSAACMAWACFAVHLHLPSWWGVVTDLSGRHLGALFGLLNSMGVAGAFTSQIFLGQFVDWLGEFGYTGRAQWDPAFYIYSGLLFLGAGVWILIDTQRSLVEPRKSAS